MKQNMTILLLLLFGCTALLFWQTSRLYERVAELQQTTDTLRVMIIETKQECTHALEIHEDLCDAQIKGITGGW